MRHCHPSRSTEMITAKAASERIVPPRFACNANSTRSSVRYKHQQVCDFRVLSIRVVRSIASLDNLFPASFAEKKRRKSSSIALLCFGMLNKDNNSSKQQNQHNVTKVRRRAVWGKRKWKMKEESNDSA